MVMRQIVLPTLPITHGEILTSNHTAFALARLGKRLIRARRPGVGAGREEEWRKERLTALCNEPPKRDGDRARGEGKQPFVTGYGYVL